MRLERAASDGGLSPLHVVAPHSGAIDFVFSLRQPLDLYRFVVELQVDDGPWLGTEAQRAPLADAGSRMRLRGLPLVTCRLRIRSTPPASGLAQEAPTIVEFVPSAAAPTEVKVDLERLLR
jgi:hypothetical protein